ncbi:MAG: carboxypeptidase-like regulatory domain-containing protein [Bacteroidales bacterium]|nr:carboxypeptidase-like regulatory domain-containing protein [Bacteroidales bacterium]
MFSGKSLAQSSILDTAISYKAKNIKLHEALTQIETIVNYNFSYNPDLVANNFIKCRYEKQSLHTILTNLINDSTLKLMVVDKQIVVTKKRALRKLDLKRIKETEIGILQIKGTILDIESKQALSFANISIKGKSRGTVSNERGVFNIKLSPNYIYDTLVFSYIGYRNSFIPMRELSFRNNLIYLKKENYKIKEAVIKTYDANKILYDAISKIGDVYYTNPYKIVAFYREMVKKRHKLMSISESVLDIYKSPYRGTYSDQIKLLKGRKSRYYTHNDTVSIKLKAGLKATLTLDLMKNPINFIDRKFMSSYKYYVTEITKFNNHKVYVIHFKPLEHFSEAFQGDIFIDVTDLSIVAVEFYVPYKVLQRNKQLYVIRKTRGVKIRPTSVKYLVNYKKIDKNYYLNFVQGELDFKIKRKKEIFTKNFEVSFELVVNEISTDNVKKFKRKEVISQNNVFLDENYEYDHQFWGKYNYISPEKSLQDAIVEIQKKIDKLN